MAEYDYYIQTKPLIPPIGKTYNFFAVVELYRKGAEKNEKIVPDFGDIWGQTEEEAYSKMEAKVKAWIASQES